LFINEKNKDDILKLVEYIDELGLKEHCPDFDFFIHEGSCDGENEKLYDIRLKKDSLPASLSPYFKGYADLKSETELVADFKSRGDECFVPSNSGADPVIYISNGLDICFNFTHMQPEWKIGNLDVDDISEISGRIKEEDIPALRNAAEITLVVLVIKYGDENSQRLFSEGYYKIYLLNRHLSL